MLSRYEIILYCSCVEHMHFPRIIVVVFCHEPPQKKPTQKMVFTAMTSDFPIEHYAKYPEPVNNNEKIKNVKYKITVWSVVVLRLIRIES